MFEKYIQLNQDNLPIDKLWLRCLGKGPRILMLHGWMHSGLRWENLVRQLSKNYECIYPDLPGFGKSLPFYSDGSMLATMTDIVETLIDLLSDKKSFYCFVGHSMGGLLLLRLLVKRKDLLPDRMILCSVPSEGIKFLKPFIGNTTAASTTLKFIQKLPNSISRKMIALSSLATVNHLYQVDSLLIDDVLSADPQCAALLLKEIAYEHFTDDISIETMKTLILRGENDRIVSRNSALNLAKSLNGTLHEFGGTNHTPMLESSAEFNNIISDFLYSY